MQVDDNASWLELFCIITMYNNQSNNYIGEFRYLYDESVKNFCKFMRRTWFVTATGARDPGVKVNARAESNLMISV